MAINDDWRPKGAPDLTHDFNDLNTQSDKERSNRVLSLAQQEYERYQKEQQIKLQEERENRPETPATKYELEHLIQQRHADTPEPHYTLGEPAYNTWDHEHSIERENRIHELTERLAPLQDHARDDFNQSADHQQDGHDGHSGQGQSAEVSRGD